MSRAPCASEIDLLLTAPSPEPAGLLASRLALAGESGELLLLFGVAGGDVTLGVVGATYAIMASLSSHLQPVNQSHVHVYTTAYLLSVLESEMFDLKCFRVLSKHGYPGTECFIALSSPEMFALLFLLEEVKLPLPPAHPPRSQNDKTSNI